MNTLAVKNKGIMGMFMRIAIPVALQNLLTFGVGLMDTIMVGALGEVELSAVTVANQPFFLFLMAIFGLASGAGTMISQYWGKDDAETISKILGLVMRVSMIVSVAATLIVLFFPEQVMLLYTREAEVIPAGVSYLRVVAYSYILFAFANAYTNCMRNAERVKVSVVVYSVSFAINVFFNYMFIFGRFGAPALGVVGAAVGTILARVAEVVIVLIHALRVEKRIRLRWKYFIRTDKVISKDYTKIALPVVINEMMWSFGSSAQIAIIGRISVTALASVSVVNSISQLMGVMMMGSGSATLVLTGKYIGAKEYDTARRTAPKLVWMNILIAAVSAVLLILLRPAFIGLYSITDSLTEATKAAINSTLLVAAAVMIFQATNLSCIVGVFRGGGDTMFAMWIDVIGVWGISVCLGALGGLVWGLSIPLTFLLLRSDEVFKAILCLVRLKSGKWLRNVTRDAGGHLERIE